MTNDQSRLVLVVDSDQRFIDDARELFAAQRILTGRDLDEAREIVRGGRVDLVLLGPGFGSDMALGQARGLLDLAPGLQMALVADVVTNRLLKAALKGGLIDVVETPLAASAVAELIDQLPAPAPIIDVVVAAAPAMDQPAAPPVQEVHPVEEISIPPVPAPVAAVVITHPASVSTPTEVTFVAEPAAPRVSEAIEKLPPETLGAVAAAATMPETVDPHLVVEPPESPSPWPEEASPTEVEQPDPTTLEPLPPEVVAPSITPPVTEALAPSAPPQAETVDQIAPNAPPAPSDYVSNPVPASDPLDVLERIMPASPGMPAPTIHQETPASMSKVERSGPGRVIAIMAGKGGSGKTVTATNLAIAIGLRDDPERVAIVDADLQFGDVALLLQIDPVRTIDDVVDQIDDMTDERLDAALLRHESGIRVLPAPLLPVRAGEIAPKSVVAVVERLRSMFDTVIVDTGPVFDDGLVMILEHADQVITVVDMDLPSVKNTKVVLDSLRQIQFDMSRIRLVVNRSNSKARLDIVELERSLGLHVGGSIPSDRLVPQSVNEGIPVLALSPRSKVARAFHALAESLESDATRESLESQ
ncbi:MAG: AAA family ATPase [Acidimicrobiia bacterium]